MLKFIYRLIYHIFIFICLLLPLQLIGILLLFIYLPIHKLLYKYNKVSIKLPYLLRWFDNADIYIPERDHSTYLTVFNGKIFPLWYWLTIRNPLNYFGYFKLGINANCTPTIVYTNNNYNVGDSIDDTAGLLYQEVLINNKSYYEYYYVKDWNNKKCLRFRMGWKIGSPGAQSMIQYVATIQPYKAII